MHDREERLALNEVLFRKANERIEESAERADQEPERIDFYCECADIDCDERIVVSAHEFDSVRTRPTQFLVLPGHEQPDIETVVLRTPVYLVVEKRGEAAEFVKEQLDDV
jgi:hypothetical protein